MGFCPQFDALIDLLTGRETLYLFARLRGLRKEFIKPAVDSLISELQLTRWADMPTKGYSGGNKRKLSVAVALMGDPAVVFLDEPTAGMDPKARRFLWTQIDRIVAEGRAVVLTSHSMDECEALCARLGIMVNGEFQAMGSPQHIKDKFGDGYTLTIKVRGSTDPVKEFIAATFVGSVLEEEHRGYLHFMLPTASIPSLPAIFGALQGAKSRLDIEDYELTQTSLEAIFCKFAQAQRLEDDTKKSKKKLRKAVQGKAGRRSPLNSNSRVFPEMTTDDSTA
jgi:ABC-type multidrug transport system ATPase subunit